MTRNIAKTMPEQSLSDVTLKGLLLMEQLLHTDPSVCTGYCLTEGTECNARWERMGEQKERRQVCKGMKGVSCEGLFAVQLRTSS